MKSNLLHKLMKRPIGQLRSCCGNQTILIYGLSKLAQIGYSEKK